VGTDSRADAAATAEQRLESLRQANKIRVGRAKLKRQLTNGEVRIADILASPPECASTQKVEDLLLALPKYGPARVGRLLVRCRISPSKTVLGLSSRQRQELIRHLPG
jgi:hypothetical protein